MGSNINPWELFLSNTPMDSEIAYRNLFAFTSVKRTADTLHHIQEKKLKDADFELRDIILAGKKQEDLGNANLFDYAKSHYKGFKSFDSNIKYDGIMRECVRRKYFFWRNVLKERPETKEKQQSKEQVISAVRGYKLPTQLFFTAAGIGIAYMLGLYNNPMSYRIICLGTGLMFGTFYGEFKYATEIFDSLPKLPDKVLERERQDIYNYCFSLDVRLIADALAKEEGLNASNEPEQKEPAKKK